MPGSATSYQVSRLKSATGYWDSCADPGQHTDSTLNLKVTVTGETF